MGDRSRMAWRGLAWMAALFLWAPAGFGAANGGAGLVRAGEAPDLVLLYTGDVIGHLDPCG